ENINELDQAVRTWRDLTIIPIREVRRKLKGAPTLVEAGRQEAFRTKIKAIELEAERLQQEALYARSRSGPPASEARPPPPAPPAVKPVRRPGRGRPLPPMSACSVRALQSRQWTAS